MKHSGILRILAVALTLSLLILAIPATPALAGLLGTISYIYPATGPPGTLVSLYGYGFTSTNSTCTVTYTVWWAGTVPLVTGATGTTGTISTSFIVPTYYTRASYPITVTTNATDTSYPVYFTTIPQITLSPSSGYVGEQITVTGSGFYASSSVTIYFDTTAVVTTSATSSGTLTSIVFTVPPSYRGTHTVKGTDALGDSSPVSFTTLQKITITPALAAVGDQITISGTGFAASQSATIYFDDETAGSATTNSVGTVSQTSFTIPASAWGSHTIRIQDASGYYATASFSTKQSTTLTPTSGPIGTKVTVSGSGFIANATVTITFDDAAVTTATAVVTTNSKGSFSTTLDIPASSGGAHQVKASDGTNTDTRTFTISATSSVSPTIR